MAIKYWIDKGVTFYQVDACARSRKSRALRVQKRETGSFEELNEESVKRKLDRIYSRLADTARRELIQKESAGMTWAELVGEWSEALLEDLNDPNRDLTGVTGSRPISKVTISGYLQSVQDFTVDRWGKFFAKEITPGDVEDLFRDMKKNGYSNCRMYNVKVAISRCFLWGIKRHMIPGVTVSPTLGFGISRRQSIRPEILNIQEINRLMSEAYRQEHSWRHVWRGAFHTGGRSGELFELRKKHVDLVERMITFEEKYNFLTKVVEPLKDKEWRYVPINDDLYALFLELGVQEMNACNYIFPRITSWKNCDAADTLRAFCKKIGIPSICFHTLRACWATQLTKNGLDDLTIMKMGGWSDVETMHRYRRLAGIEVAGATQSLCLKNERPGRILKLASIKESQEINYPANNDDEKKYESGRIIYPAGDLG